MLFVFIIDNAGLSMDSYTQTKEDNADVMCELPAIMKYDPTIDERLPETVTLLTTPDGGKLYLIGTAHFSIESQNDVSKVAELHSLIYLLPFALVRNSFFF